MYDDIVLLLATNQCPGIKVRFSTSFRSRQIKGVQSAAKCDAHIAIVNAAACFFRSDGHSKCNCGLKGETSSALIRLWVGTRPMDIGRPSDRTVLHPGGDDDDEEKAERLKMRTSGPCEIDIT